MMALAGLTAAVAAFAELPSWVRNVEASSALEAVFFRMMSFRAEQWRFGAHRTRLAPLSPT